MRRSERGSNLVEMAIVLPLLVLLLAGVVDFGRAFYGYITIANAAREGARAGAKLSCYSTNATQREVYKDRILQAVMNEVDGSIIAPGDLTIAIDPDPVLDGICQTGGLPVTVTVSTDHHMIMTGILGLTEITLTASSDFSRVGKSQP